MRLPNPHLSYVVLIGTSTYRSSQLDDLPSVRNNLRDLAAVLTDPNLGAIPDERCIIISDPEDARTVYRTLRRYARAAEDTLLVYFAGHGQTGSRNELYLGLADTAPDELRVSALAFDLVRDVLTDCPAANRVVILDCCFSGRAIQDMGGEEETILGQVAVEGTYVLASTPVNGVALAPAGASNTAFTGQLLNLLRTGVPGGPAFLTYGEIYRRLLHTTALHGLPAPRQRGTGTVDLLALVRNAAVPGAGTGLTAAAEQSVAPLQVQPEIPSHSSSAQPQSPPPATPHRADEWKRLRSIGWIALIATWLYGLGPLSMPISMLIESLASPSLDFSFRELATGSPDHGITLIDVTLPLVNILVGLLVWRLTRRHDIRAWIAVCVILAYGLADAVGIPFAISAHLYHHLHLYLSVMPEVILAGRGLLAVAAVASCIAIARMHPRVEFARPPRLGMPIAILVLALTISCTSFVIGWHTKIGVLEALEDGAVPRLARCILLSLLSILLPIGGLTIRPWRLGVGLVAGWLTFALSIEIMFISAVDYDRTFLNNDASLSVSYALFGLANAGMLGAFWWHFRGMRDHDPRSRPAEDE
ncbi:caspase family protein [Streptomyces werraensis]|uniref:caspase family protein n=1 Tax=Streptomyces werraensis TaxID=68284 RepID=UPI0033AC6E1A